MRGPLSSDALRRKVHHRAYGTLAIRRRSKLWLWLLIAAMAVALVTHLAPISYLLKDGGMLLLGALLVVALIGPRHETAFA